MFRLKVTTPGRSFLGSCGKVWGSGLGFDLGGLGSSGLSFCVFMVGVYVVGVGFRATGLPWGGGGIFLLRDDTEQ